MSDRVTVGLTRKQAGHLIMAASYRMGQMKRHNPTLRRAMEALATACDGNGPVHDPAVCTASVREGRHLHSRDCPINGPQGGDD